MKNLFIAIVLLFNLSANAGIICIQRGTQTFIENSLDTAILHAQNGDVIYLPSGSIPGSTCTINKQLSIIGCGYNIDSTLATGTTNVQTLIFDVGSDASILTGVIANNITAKANITLTRNTIGFLELNNGSANISIFENYINGFTNNSQINSFTHYVRQNVFGNGVVSNQRGVVFSNNIFLISNYLYSNWGFYYSNYLTNIDSCIFINNIFMNWSSHPYFNIVGSIYSYSNDQRNNIFEKNIFSASDFTNSTLNYANVNPLFSQGYHLATGCVGINSGTDGTDIGIYGTPNPWKDGGLPSNPHFISIHVTQQITNQGGTLGVDFNVETQDH
jgi:hypothetical protein